MKNDEIKKHALFAHIFAADWLAGSPLEGLPVSSFPRYLLQFINVTSVNNTTLTSLIASFLLIDNEVETLFITNSSRNSSTDSTSNYVPIAQNIHKMLENKNDILIPGGWCGTKTTSGHGMIYRLRIIHNMFYFIVYNTGDGISNHPLQLAKDSYFQVNAKFAFKINAENIWNNPSLFTQIISQIISITVDHKVKAADADKLYNELLPQLCMLDAVFVCDSDENIQPSWIKPQTSGVCGKSCWDPLLQELLGTDYLKFDYEFKKLVSSRKTVNFF